MNWSAVLHCVSITDMLEKFVMTYTESSFSGGFYGTAVVSALCLS
jgi:hypothetical protein